MKPRTTFSDSLTVLPTSSQPSSPRKSTYHSQTLWIPFGARGVFGGQVIAQALVASSQTVDPKIMGLHSQHCYFLLPAHSTPPIEYHVEKIRDGKSYANRLVKAIQKGKVIFILAASYTVPPINLPVLKSNEGTPMSFQPYLPENENENENDNRSSSKKQHQKDNIKEKENSNDNGGRTGVSHSLRFAVDSSDSPSSSSSPSSLKNHKEEHTHSGPAPTGINPGWRKEDDHNIPTYQSKFQLPFPDDVLPPEDCPEEEERWSRYLEEVGVNGVSKRRRHIIEEYIQERKESPVSISAARFKGRDSTDGFSNRNIRMTWCKPRLTSRERPSEELTKAMIAYITDFQFIGTSAHSIGLTWASYPRLGMLASLDHTTHFYPFPNDFKAGDPMLHVMESAVADVSAGRGLARGVLYDRKGRLLAVTLQEGVVRANFGDVEKKSGKEEKGEKGMMVKAKL